MKTVTSIITDRAEAAFKKHFGSIPINPYTGKNDVWAQMFDDVYAQLLAADTEENLPNPQPAALVAFIKVMENAGELSLRQLIECRIAMNIFHHNEYEAACGANDQMDIPADISILSNEDILFIYEAQIASNSHPRG